LSKKIELHDLALQKNSVTKSQSAWLKLKKIAEDKEFDAAFAVQESKVTLYQKENKYGDHGIKQINE